MSLSIAEVIENYGPICASDEDTGYLVAINGSYMNLYVPDARGGYTCLDCTTWGDCDEQPNGHDLHTATGSLMIDECEAYLARCLAPDEDEEN